MIFGRVPLDQAVGAVLAHTQRLPDRTIKKGSVLDAAAVEGLRATGMQDVVAARLEAGDVGEDEAAHRLADALMTPGLTRTRASTGRVNLAAAQPGLLLMDRSGIDTLNSIDESLTLGTLPDAAVVAAREMVATIKVIPFAVPGPVLARAVAAADGRGLIRLHPFRPLRVGLVMSTLPGLKPSVLAGTAEATRARVRALTGTMLPPVQCPHAEGPIAAALLGLVQLGADILLVAGASAVVDRRDAGPGGIVAAGGDILHFGMPVDPGNLICLGRIGSRPALVLPGCARSPKLNGIDWVLSRLFAGAPLDGGIIARMGVGGLLKDVAARPLPRAKAAPPSHAVAAGPPPRSVAGIVLAAGRSSRMAPHNKLLIADRSGRSMVARVADNLLSAQLRPVLIVTGHHGEEVVRSLAGRPVRIVSAPDYAAGLSASLRAGLAAVPPECPAVLVCLGDMPLVTGRMMQRLLDAYDPNEDRTIVAPTCRGAVGNPVLWDRRFFPEIMALQGDSGARRLMERHMASVALVDIGDDAVLRDFDTAQSLAELRDYAAGLAGAS